MKHYLAGSGCNHYDDVTLQCTGKQKLICIIMHFWYGAVSFTCAYFVEIGYQLRSYSIVIIICNRPWKPSTILWICVVFFQTLAHIYTLSKNRIPHIQAAHLHSCMRCSICCYSTWHCISCNYLWKFQVVYTLYSYIAVSSLGQDIKAL